MKLSFIIPSYNAAWHLGACLDSIYNLDINDYAKEVIVVNDGSEDNTLQLLEDYRRLKPELVVITQDNKGLSMARNAGLDCATGDYICFVDADDVLLQTDVSPILQRMREGIDVIGINVVAIKLVENCREEQKHPYQRYVPKYDKVYTPAEDFMRDRNLMPCSWAYVYRRAFLEDNNLRFHPGIYHEDEELTPRVFACAKTFVAVNVTLYGYIYQEGSITTTTDPTRQQQKLRDMVTILRRLDAMHVDSMRCKLDWLTVDILRILLRQRHHEDFISQILSELKDAGFFPLRWHWNIKHILFNIFTRMKFSLTLFIIIFLTVHPVCAQNDYSNLLSIKINEPSIAYVNITGINALPTTKTENLHAWFEYSDDEGNTFRKRVIINAQGASSLQYPKKNMSVDFCEDEWIGDKTTSIQIGKWVSQDGFHFKANWIDTFRGGLAVVTAYRLYDDIVADEPHILERAGMKTYDESVLCHPDGFPCVISLNGEFQGVYAWQLKKHRKNMGMEKSTGQHVWFQLETYTSSFETGVMNWDHIEIRNPKTVTDETRDIISRLASYNNTLKALEQTASDEEIREEIAKRYDVTSVIDYIIHGLITSNVDGFGKNAHFFTYDGEKWFVAPYDLDETFGNTWISTFQFPAGWTICDDAYDMQATIKWTPFTWVRKYFWEEICERYATLRRRGVLTTENIIAHLTDWNQRVGEDNYGQEYRKWDSCPSSGSTIIDDSWEQTDWTDYNTTPQYSDTKTYMTGEKCRYDYRVWKARTEVKGRTPVVQAGYTDTEDRVRSWLDERIALEDKYLGYTATGLTPIHSDVVSQKPKKVLVNGHILIEHNANLYSVEGVKVK